MKKIVSFFADHSETFDQLNRQAADHARALGYDYRWEPQSPFQADQVIAALKEADVGIIDVEPYGEEIFKEIQGHTKLLVRFGVGFDKVDLAARQPATASPSPAPLPPTPAAWPRWPCP